ncbi:hypothetical protein DXT94_23730 [Rhizobium sp. ICMP 5592]|nr:hypothetical protein [Rhizobium sp. ICMP 5592]
MGRQRQVLALPQVVFNFEFIAWVRAVLALRFKWIHRWNPIGMRIAPLPLRLPDGNFPGLQFRFAAEPTVRLLTFVKYHNIL